MFPGENDLLEIIKKNKAFLLIPLLLIALFYLFRDQVWFVIQEQNFLITHLIIEFFLVTVSATIALQAWMIFPHTLSTSRLFLGSLFFSIAILEIGHAITYKGMPFFFVESSAYQATWFYMSSRWMLAIGMLILVLMPERKVAAYHRWLAYGVSFALTLSWIVLLYHPRSFLPELVIEGVGTTVLKNNLQFTALGIQLVVILLILLRYRKSHFFYLMMLMASLFIICSDYMYTMYTSVYAFENFMGHILQVMGFFYLLQGLYYTSVEEPFQKQKEAERQLKKDRELIEYMAYYDDLTGLPNRRFFQDRVQEQIGQHPERQAAVFILDIDRFRMINESLGYSFGDKFLHALTQKLTTHIPSTILMARFYGERFSLFLPSFEHEAEIEDLGSLIQDILKKPIQVEHTHLRVLVNIGVALYPEHGTTCNELVKHANNALNLAKEKNNRFQIYCPTMNEEMLDQLVLENDLSQALKNEELYLVYQPQIDLESKRVHSVEALLRWNHPSRGPISPATFIPVAEKSGLIIPIGEWVMRSACHQLKRWHEQGLVDLGVAVNLSTGQFYQDNLVEVIRELLEAYQLPPTCLELEITESMSMLNMEHAKDILQELKALGVRIAIDDFGTGYSSLNYLNNFPFDRLKIDRSFFRDLNDENQNSATIVSLIISMAQHLKMDVLAEGVEHLDQVKFLLEKNCTKVQGYLFSKPLEPADLPREIEAIQARLNNASSLSMS